MNKEGKNRWRLKSQDLEVLDFQNQKDLRISFFLLLFLIFFPQTTSSKDFF